MSVQIYGQFSDHGSFSNVSRAITDELLRRHFDVTVYGIGSLNPTYVNMRASVVLRSSTQIGICVSYPEVAPSWLQGHKVKVLVTVCETDQIPQSWVKACNDCDLIVVPSEWCREAFKNSGVRPRILVVNHGVSTDLLGPAVSTLNEPLRFLHVSGSLSFSARKGTAKLFRAWKRLAEEFGPTTPKLLLKMHNTEGTQLALDSAGIRDYVELLPQPSLSPMEMGQLLRSVDGTIQPSRAEGFGLLPLESRCVGTPNLMTAVTGHADHFSTLVDCVIPTGPPKLLETQGNSIGKAPTLKTEDVFQAVKRFISNIEYAKKVTMQWSKLNAKNWTWQRVLTPLMRELKLCDVRERMALGGHAGLRGIMD